MRVLILSGSLAALCAWVVWMPSALGVEAPVAAEAKEGKPAPADAIEFPPAKPPAPFVEKALGWLSEAQHPSGGWGAGSHAKQQNKDPHKVKTDPATTAFSALALLRCGHTPTVGSYQQVVRKATEYLVETVEKAPSEGPKITDVSGTQPQSKLGKLVDTTMTTQYLARVLKEIPADDPLHDRVDKALDKCVKKLQAAQKSDGSWNVGGGWAPVLQSSSGTQALELAAAAGNKQVDRRQLENARKYQKKNFNAKTGKVDAKSAAGVELYAFSSSQRANATEARAADEVIAKAKREGKLEEDAEVSEENLTKAGVAAPKAATLASAAQQNAAQIGRLDDANLLKGFGNNGGEEFVSYLLTSESMIIAGGDGWAKWNDKMHGLLKKVQNPDGSWSGHHCITSPVFCTAAVVQCLTADHDAEMLVALAKKEADEGME